jgi:WD40 repeat protein
MDKSIKVWDTESGAQLATLSGHKMEVNCVAFSPDGTRIASGSSDDTVRVWDAESGEALLVLRGHEQFVTLIAFSPCGNRIVSCSCRGTLRVWNANNGAELAAFEGRTRNMFAVAFSPRGDRIVALSRFFQTNRTVPKLVYDAKAWDIASGRRLEPSKDMASWHPTAFGKTQFPLRALVRGSTTVIERTGTNTIVAQLPLELKIMAIHPSGRAWAGSSGNHIFIITLEGGPEQVSGERPSPTPTEQMAAVPGQDRPKRKRWWEFWKA